MQAHSEVIALAGSRRRRLVADPEPEWITRAADELGYAWARSPGSAPRQCPAHGSMRQGRSPSSPPVAGWFSLTTGRFAGKPFRWRSGRRSSSGCSSAGSGRSRCSTKTPAQPTDDYVRLFPELRLWIPRKNGKSEFLAALALLFWAIEGERAARASLCARREDQAREVFDKMSDMVGYCADLVQPTSRCCRRRSGSRS
jgi:hypothetical protein